MRLFHFSDDPGIARFEPRAVKVPSARPPGRDWLNGPLVWAIDDWHSPMYLFPRDCPRILLWPTEITQAVDHKRWFGNSTARMVAHVEEAWRDRIAAASIQRYELPAKGFESLDDAGMYVSREAVVPLRRETIADLPAALRAAKVELRVLKDLTPLKGVWNTTLHASGIRLRNAAGW